MNSSLDQIIKNWLTNNLATVTATNPVSVHLDDLLGQRPQSDQLESATAAFLIMLNHIQCLQMPVKPVLVIPLVTLSPKIERAIPKDITHLKQQLSLEPPSLYLLDWATSEYGVTGEAYWSPLAFRLFAATVDDLLVYYKEVRYGLAIEDDWEFARSIYVESIGTSRPVSLDVPVS